MKAFILALSLCFSMSASAQSVMLQPMLINFGNMVQVQVRNTTDKDVNCSGQIYMNTNTGRMESAFYFDHVMKGAFSMRSFYLSNFSERITFAHHSIFCHQR